MTFWCSIHFSLRQERLSIDKRELGVTCRTGGTGSACKESVGGREVGSPGRTRGLLGWCPETGEVWAMAERWWDS